MLLQHIHIHTIHSVSYVWNNCIIPFDNYDFSLFQIMDETQTQIAWPSKLKIGAKSKKGDYFFFLILLLYRIHALFPLFLPCVPWVVNGKPTQCLNLIWNKD